MARDYRDQLSQAVSFSFGRHEIERLNAFCRERKLNRSRLVRDAVAAYLAAVELQEAS